MTNEEWQPPSAVTPPPNPPKETKTIPAWKVALAGIVVVALLTWLFAFLSELPRHYEDFMRGLNSHTSSHQFDELTGPLDGTITYDDDTTLEVSRIEPHPDGTTITLTFTAGPNGHEGNAFLSPELIDNNGNYHERSMDAVYEDGVEVFGMSYIPPNRTVNLTYLFNVPLDQLTDAAVIYGYNAFVGNLKEYSHGP